MYVCICNALTEKDVRAAVDGGARSAAEVFGRFGARAQCGYCVADMQGILRPCEAGPERRGLVPDRRLSAKPIDAVWPAEQERGG